MQIFDVTRQLWRAIRFISPTPTTPREVSNKILLPAIVRWQKKLGSRLRLFENSRSISALKIVKGKALHTEAQSLVEGILCHFYSIISQAEWVLLELSLSKIIARLGLVPLKGMLAAPFCKKDWMLS